MQFSENYGCTISSLILLPETLLFHQKKFPLVPCLTSTLAADFNVKTTIRAKCYESSNPPKSSKIGFKPWKHYCGRAFHQKYQMFSNGNSTNFSTAPLRIIDIFSEADILNIKSWKKLNFLFWAPLRKCKKRIRVNTDPTQGQIQHDLFWKL